jgi:hypothetical protein
MGRLRFLGSLFLRPLILRSASPLPIPPAIKAMVLFLVFCAYGQAQDTYKPESVRVSNLPTLMARSHDPSDVLLTSLDTILRDREVCCGKDSALEDSAQRADPASPQDVAAKLQGRHLLSDGRPIAVTATYIAPNAINANLLIETLRQQHAMLLFWKSRLYVLYGATYMEEFDPNSGIISYNILTLLLIDSRYSDSRRNVEFNRETDDWTKVQGVLWVAAAPQ